MMTKSLYDSGMTPVNKMAARVVSKGTTFTPSIKPGAALEQKTPYPIRELREIPHDLRHLVGYRFGRLTVIGFSHIPKRWSVRCSCGMYCIRSTKAISNPKNVNDSCLACAAMLRSLRRDHVQRTGKNIDTDSLPSAVTERAPLPPPVKGGPRYVAHNSARSVEPAPREPEPLHWTAQQRSIPTALASAFQAAAAASSKPPERP